MTNQTTNNDNLTQNIIENTTMSTEVKELVSQYKTGIGKTVEGILGMSKAVLEASFLTNHKDRNMFFIEANLDRNSSTCKKLKSIGERYDFFLKNQRSLPSSWTSLYLLTKLEENKFNGLVEREIINPMIKGKEILDIVGSKPRIIVKKDLSSNSSFFDNEDDISFKVIFQGDQISKVDSIIREIIEMIKSNGELNIILNEKCKTVFDFELV